jgi:hypothetical protein
MKARRNTTTRNTTTRNRQPRQKKTVAKQIHDLVKELGLLDQHAPNNVSCSTTAVLHDM